MHELLEFVLQNSVIMIWFVPCLRVIIKILSKVCREKYRYYMCLLPIMGFVLPLRYKVVLPVLITAENGQIPIHSYQTMLNESVGEKGFFVIWLTGLFLFLMLSIVWHIRSMRMIGRWKREFSRKEVMDRFENLKKKYGITNQIQFKLCPCIHTPMTVYLSHPAILLPSETYSEEELDMIISHELVHIKRKDIVYKILQLLFLAVYWFHPFAYWLIREIQNLCETSCDEAVLKDADIGTRTRYIEMLLQMAEGYAPNTQSTLSMEFVSKGKRLKRRIWSVRHETRSSWYGIVTVIFAGVIISIGLTVRVECKAFANEVGGLESNRIEQEHGDIDSTENEIKDEAEKTADPKTENTAGEQETNRKTDLVFACIGNGNTITEIYDLSSFRNIQFAVNSYTFALAVENK